MYHLKSTYGFHLPENLVATHPSQKRDACRLLVINREEKRITHYAFSDIVSLFRKGDVLVVNNAKVIPARLYAVKKSGGKIEVLLIKKIDDDVWEVLTKGRNISEGMSLNFAEGVEARVVSVYGKEKVLSFSKPITIEYMKRNGEIPLPPYIIRRRKEEGESLYTIEDESDYQSVYAENEGSVASPTASLHFTEDLLNRLREKGVIIESLTLHVGFGTFLPIEEEDITKHKMHEESFEIPFSCQKAILDAKKNGQRVVACGTTTTRVLESEYDKEKNSFKKAKGSTNIFIYPPYEFQCVNAMLTNFHTPHSTLLAMVSAFSGYELLMKAYAEAVEKEYRFFSYGDAMFIE